MNNDIVAMVMIKITGTLEFKTAFIIAISVPLLIMCFDLNRRLS
jgi:hypothetical protein